MKRITLGRLAASALLMAVPLHAASAADMPVKAPPAPVATGFDWSSFYVGGFAGYAWTGSETTADPCLVGVVCTVVGTYNAVPPVTYPLKSSFNGGADIGFNWEIVAPLVVGFENKLGYLNLSGSKVMNPPPGIGDTTANAKIGNWYDAYTARIGLAFGHGLAYLSGGGASVAYSTGVVDTTPPVTINTSMTTTITTWAYGGGLEYAFDPHWSVRAEYLGFGLRGLSINHCGLVFPFVVTDCSSTKLSAVNTVNVGINYRFGIPGHDY